MANTNLVELFTGIADSIRAKDGTTETIAPIDFASRIEALSVGSNEDIEWHWVKGDSTFLSDFKANVTNLDDLICLIVAPGVSSGGYPFIYVKGPGSYADNILYCSVYQNSAWQGYAVNSTTTYIDLEKNIIKRNGTQVNGGEYFYRYAYGIKKDSGPITDSPASMNIITFTTEIPSSQTIADTFPVPEEHKTTLTSVSQLISVEGYWYDDDSYYTYSYIPQRVLQFKTSKRLERCPNGVWDTNINASTSLTLSSDGVIGTSDRTGWAKGYPIKVTYMVTK